MRKPSFWSSLMALVASAAVLAGCSGHAASVVPGDATNAADSRAASAPSSSQASLKAVKGRFVIRVPKQAGRRGRRPLYVSGATLSFTAQVTDVKNGATDITPNPAPPLLTVNVPNGTGSAPGGACANDPSNAGDFLCTIALQMYVGADTVALSAYSAANAGGSLLSSQNAVETVVAGTVNSFTITLDANAATLTLTGGGSCQVGTVGNSVSSVGTTPVTFSASYTDPAGKTIVGPGLPTLSILGNDAAYHSTSGTINATGGTVAFTINQAAQTFTLTPSSASTTNASVAVESVPANSSGTPDGLSFNLTQTFTFSTGAAPPAHNFLAAVEQMGSNSGQIDLFNVALGGSGAADTFMPYSTATLPVTNSSNQGKQDVDNPLDLAWDTNGDLLIGNGGTTVAGDTGNLACVPAGAIASGANSATTVTTDVDDPVGLAYDSRNGTVALANNPVSAPEQLSEYVETGDYTAAPTADDLAVPGYGAFSVVDLPTQPAGTFAVALTTGTEADTSHSGTGHSKIAILGPGGAETDITDTTTYAIDEPYGVDWDPTNDQLVIANFSSFHKLLSFYTLAGTQVKTINTGRRNYKVAAAPNGTIAVAGSTAFGYPQVQVYDATSARNPVNGPIPFNSIDNQNDCLNNGAPYLYGDGVVVNGLTWLSNTKLLVALQAYTGGSANATNGFYIYDVSATATPAGVDDASCNAFGLAPRQTGFQHIANKPLAAAFKI